MIKLIFISVLFLAFPVFAVSDGSGSGSWSFGGFFSEVEAFFQMIHHFIFEQIPLMFQRAVEYFYYYAILIKIKSLIFFMKVSFGVAALFLSDIGLASAMNAAVNALPQDMQALVSQLGLIRAINIVIEAYIARYVLQYML